MTCREAELTGARSTKIVVATLNARTIVSENGSDGSVTNLESP
jgi:hypothetical protein